MTALTQKAAKLTNSAGSEEIAGITESCEEKEWASEVESLGSKYKEFLEDCEQLGKTTATDVEVTMALGKEELVALVLRSIEV